MKRSERRAQHPASAPTPHRTEQWWHNQRLVQILALVAIAWGGAYLTWRLGWSRAGVPSVLFAALFAAEAFGWLSFVLYAYLGWRVQPSIRPPLPDSLPSIDVFVCTYDESVTVLERTLLGCRALPIPHTTYLLDDGRRPEMAALAARLGAEYITREDNDHAKAGNINHALSVTSGDLIFFLDADHVPLPYALDALVGYFSDPNVALVQTPHDFSNRDSVQHTGEQRHEQSLFYDVIAPNKDRQNAMFWCGSATLIRRSALGETGGVLTATVAEDFHTTIAMHARGWRTRYHNETLVQALAPHNLAGFILQRARWARGNLAVFRTRENPLVCRGLTASQRLSYTASLLNYFDGLQRLALLGVLSWTLATGQLPMHADLLPLLALWLPFAILAFAGTNALSRGCLGPFDSTRYGLLTMGLQIRALVALFVRSAGAFKVTPKDHPTDIADFSVLRMLGLLTATTLTLAVVWLLRVATLVGVVHLPPITAFPSAVVVTLGAWELVFMGITIRAVVRRRQVREDFRFPVELEGRIDGTETTISLLDLSPEGLAFTSPVELPVGLRLVVLTRMLDASGTRREARIPVITRTASRMTDGRTRVGAQTVDLTSSARELVIEYCYIAQPARQRDATWATRGRDDEGTDVVPAGFDSGSTSSTLATVPAP
ncbi:MAG: glycosyltransferase [Acidimicrobiia bacterium]|nr:glycosyltransferase [Acidimicrobiia bacterium]